MCPSSRAGGSEPVQVGLLGGYQLVLTVVSSARQGHLRAGGVACASLLFDLSISMALAWCACSPLSQGGLGAFVVSPLSRQAETSGSRWLRWRPVEDRISVFGSEMCRRQLVMVSGHVTV